MGFGDNIDRRICPTFNDFTACMTTDVRVAFDSMDEKTRWALYQMVNRMIESAIIFVRRQAGGT